MKPATIRRIKDVLFTIKTVFNSIALLTGWIVIFLTMFPAFSPIPGWVQLTLKIVGIVFITCFSLVTITNTWGINVHFDIENEVKDNGKETAQDILG